MDSGDVDTPPARKKARALSLPLPSLHGSPPPTSTHASPTSEMHLITPLATPFQPDLALTMPLALPSLVTHYTSLPPSLQLHLLLTLLQHSLLPVLRMLHSALGRACCMCKGWRGRIKCNKVLWQDLLVRRGLWFGGENEGNFVKMLLRKQHHAIQSNIHIYDPTSGRLIQKLDGHEGGVWALAVHGNLLVSGSTDWTVRIWDLDDPQGRCLHVFGGHTGTVRCLAIVKPKLWGREKEKVWRLPKRNERPFDSCLSHQHAHTPPSPHPSLPSLNPPLDDPTLNLYHIHLLSGHTDAVRVLAACGRALVSGSYDCMVRVWDVVEGHSQKVYSVLLDSSGDSASSILGSGLGYGLGWGLGAGGSGSGASHCALGSMDGTVHLWSISTGQCLAVLSGHTSLVGLLGLSPSFLVSAAADSTLRVWDARNTPHASLSNSSTRNPTSLTPGTGAEASAGGVSTSNNLLRGIMSGHTGAITCFQHKEWKVVSGSDGTLKVWDLRDINVSVSFPGGPGLGAVNTNAAFGGVTRSLLTGIRGIWQVAFKGTWCVSASNRNDVTVLDVWDFYKEWLGEPPSGVYDYEDSELEFEGDDIDIDLEHESEMETDTDSDVGALPQVPEAEKKQYSESQWGV
ncbi:WD40 repeat-like protein [Gymnopus androsaceus JB14]|uniref:WD40 repeat-like protein n=1 Tax=Gymnopus androsaceus JB14 TaxID=1447944 RepID=A0A6A4GFM3_9AGAR|nr:WD40 repeat-like protein [Gymnopus androsaceus JB14]